MKARSFVYALIACLGVSGCTDNSGSETYTLYRNSVVGSDIRIHVATFDAEEMDRLYNHNNCEMSARLRNANVRAFNPATDQKAGFWCEPGKFVEKGSIPFTFDSEFPTDVP